MTPEEARRAQDMIAAMEVQRNQALSQIVYLQADLAAAKRKIAELEAKAKSAEGDASLPLLSAMEGPKANGHAKAEANPQP